MNAVEFFGDWGEVIDFKLLDKTLNSLGTIMQSKRIAPEPENLFRAFRCCPFNKLRLVMVGLDPYPNGKATGIAFGNSKDTPFNEYSPSLKVLYNAVDEYCKDDLPFSTIDEVFPTLEKWEEQGILLLNSALSVEINKVGSHTALWRPFIKSLLVNLQNKDNTLIFVLMGEVAQTFKSYLNKDNVICCVHPSRCARTGEKFPNIFKQIDDKMNGLGKDLIYWI